MQPAGRISKGSIMTRYGTSIRFLVSNALSLLGNSVAGIALPLIVLATTGDALAAGTLALVCAIPQVMFGVLGGAVLDRFNRRNVSIVSDVVSAVSVALLPVVDLLWGLDFAWFAVLGVLGAVGDIPGMTARDTLAPAVSRRDGMDLQRYLGLSQSIDSLMTIVGPAVAAFLIGAVGGVNTLWVTAALSLSAAVVTTTIPRAVGAVRGADGSEMPLCARGAAEDAETPRKRGLMAAAFSSLRTGLRVLLRDDAVLRASMLLSLGSVMVFGSFQGLVLPAFFTEAGHPELLGYVLSAMSAGLLMGTLAYTALAPRFARRTWYVVSLVGMAASVLALGLLPAFPALLAAACALGFTSGPVSALLGFFMLDRIPAASRGSALGTQNSLMLVVAPAGVFVSSVVVSVAGTAVAAFALAALWVVVTLAALAARSMRSLDDEALEGRDAA